MKAIIVTHARRKIGMDAYSRRQLGVVRKEQVVLRTAQGTVREKVFKVPSACANLRAVLGPDKVVVFAPARYITQLGVTSGSEIDLLTERQATTTPPPLPAARLSVQASGGVIGSIRQVLSELTVGREISSKEIRELVQERFGTLLGDISSAMTSLKDKGEVKSVDRGVFKVVAIRTAVESEV